ncbi:MAG: dynamin family protein [Halioglobus sp.]|nr:dynamin family protein [Halioglobus sp.]
MKTNMQEFCKVFSRELEPFGEALRQALSGLPRREDIRPIAATILELQEVQQRLSTLREKVSNQRTFLLIFGPLKSGKSTLMNALSGAYVSEVSSLPAYPALVYVKNGERQRFEATDYEGSTREFPDNMSLSAAVQRDHANLADAIVAAENQGESFEPQRHYPQAIRRMDIEVPAAHLAESGSVLVDTPGLYSHMKFGYDQMTRDFRDTAACAIFVVKTDNLFFEKVFEEFEELLSCFSRIFLVANIDSSKQDLQADGTLQPSLESRDPQKIIDSFRSLSMSATLRDAIEDDRLKIYPIDLQAAASRTLRTTAATGPATADEEGDEVAAGPGSDGFDQFVTDLTGYLNSSDYLHDFMVDSLRLAQDLTAEAARLVSGESADALHNSNRQAREELGHERIRLAALEALQQQQDWSTAFATLRESKDRQLGAAMEQGTTRLESACREQLAAWMETDESWNDLLERRLVPQLQQESARQSEQLFKVLHTQTESGHAGAEFSEAQRTALREAGLAADQVLCGYQPSQATIQATTPSLALDIEEIPVTRTLGDYFLFRSRNRVRQEIFGDNGNRNIDPAVKRKRLKEGSLEKIRAAMRETVSRKMPELQKRYADELVDKHVRQCTEALQNGIVQRETQLQEWIISTEPVLRLRQQAEEVLERIKDSSERFDRELGRINSQFDLHPATDDKNDTALQREEPLQDPGAPRI